MKEIKFSVTSHSGVFPWDPLINPVEYLANQTNNRIVNYREETLKSIVDSLGISVRDLEERMKMTSSPEEHTELLTKCLNEAGYRFELSSDNTYVPGEAKTIETISVYKLVKEVETIYTSTMEHRKEPINDTYTIKLRVEEKERDFSGQAKNS
ncbi:hypothetical protein D1872_51990 [compost metagenome]